MVRLRAAVLDDRSGVAAEDGQLLHLLPLVLLSDEREEVGADVTLREDNTGGWVGRDGHSGRRHNVETRVNGVQWKWKEGGLAP